MFALQDDTNKRRTGYPLGVWQSSEGWILSRENISEDFLMIFTAVIKLSVEAAEEAIKRALRQCPGFGLEETDTIKKVKFVITEELEGYGVQEHSVNRFSHVEIDVEREM
jgi:hypothetical protein